MALEAVDDLEKKLLIEVLIFLDQSLRGPIAVIEIQTLKTAAKTMHFAKIVYSIRKGYEICLKKVQNLNQDHFEKIKFGQHRGKLG